MPEPVTVMQAGHLGTVPHMGKSGGTMAHTPGPYIIAEPGGPAGPFYGIVNDKGNVVAMQILRRDDALLWKAAPDLLAVSKAVAERPSGVQEMMRREGFVIDDLDDRWQKFAFTLYTIIAADAAQAAAAIAQASASDEDRDG